MELQVHRSRFVDWSPTGITCMAFPPVPPPSPHSPKDKIQEPRKAPPKWFGTLAIGRANGNIELLEWTGGPTDEVAPQAWALKRTLTGPLRSKIESLAFALRSPKRYSLHEPPALSDLRLFSSGGGTDIVEWDLSLGTTLRTYPVHGGSIWSIAVNPSSTLIACGCDDGTVRLLSLEDDDILMFRTMGPGKGKVLSVAWGPPVPRSSPAKRKTNPESDADLSSDEESDGDEWIDQWIVTGGSDAAIKRWSMKSGTVVANYKTDQLRSTRTLIWALGVLADGTVVSGDSMGLIKFWDAHTSTQLNSIKGHDADVLCLAIGSDGTTVFSSGVDQLVTECALIQTATEYGRRSDWAKTSSRRLHAHDVRAMAVWPPYSPFPSSHRLVVNRGIAPLLVSGGQDMIPVVTPCTSAGIGIANAAMKVRNPLAISNDLAIARPSIFSQSIQERIPYPVNGLLCVAKDPKLLVCRRLTGISIWRVQSGNAAAKGAQDFDHVIDMEMSFTTHIITCAISDDGKWLAASDALELKLFYIADIGESRLVRVKVVSNLLMEALHSIPSKVPSAAASKIVFTPDSTKLLVACSPTSAIVVFDLQVTPFVDAHHSRTFDEHFPSYSGRVVKRLAGESSAPPHDSPLRHSARLTTLAVSPDGQWLASADEEGRCNVFNLDNLQHHCTLPSFERPIRDMKFHPDRPQVLVCAQVNNSIQVFDVETRTFPAWAKDVPEKFKTLKPGVEGLLFVKAASTSPNHILLAWGWNWICKIKLEGSAHRTKSKKSRSGWVPKEEFDAERESFNVFTGYRQMLGVMSLGGNEIIVVERPSLDLLMADGLPPPFHKHKYGT